MIVLVVGTGRCGSSAVARILEDRIGVDMGGPGTIRPENPLGDYERTEIKAMDWAAMDALPKPWGAKYPAMATHFRPFLNRYKPHVIWAHRNLWDTALSWERAYGRDARSCLNTVARRWRAIGNTLDQWPLDTLTIDMTDRLTDKELEDVLRGFLPLG